MMYLPFSLTVLSTVTKTSSALNIFGMTRQEISRFWGVGEWLHVYCTYQC
jgi:hypothetical protein